MTRDKCLELFDYDRTRGRLFWKVRRSNNVIGHEAGSLVKNGYRRVGAFNREYYVHRLIWLIETGSMPETEIDHKNGDRSDNRFDNLRLATFAENHFNQKVRKDSASGVKGVNWVTHCNMYRVRIKAHGICHEVGYFKSRDAAIAAYRSAADRFHGEFACPFDRAVAGPDVAAIRAAEALVDQANEGK